MWRIGRRSHREGLPVDRLGLHAWGYGMLCARKHLVLCVCTSWRHLPHAQPTLPVARVCWAALPPVTGAVPACRDGPFPRVTWCTSAAVWQVVLRHVVDDVLDLTRSLVDGEVALVNLVPPRMMVVGDTGRIVQVRAGAGAGAGGAGGGWGGGWEGRAVLQCCERGSKRRSKTRRPIAAASHRESCLRCRAFGM